MKVAIIGGTGVFGERLARLLARDGHDLILVSRGGGGALAETPGAQALMLDRDGDLTPLFACRPDVVVDAAGPFQAYGDDPYRLPRAAIAAGVGYMDLSDDAAFCAGIARLDTDAKAAGVFVLSGVSSVPALSSAAVAALSRDMTRIEAIDSAILPGNRAPRGRSVMAAILAQVGRPVETWQDGAVEPVPGWSHPCRYTLPGGVTRAGWVIGAPDLALFPRHFGARSVTFRAGLELGVMNRALAALSALRQMVPMPAPLGPLHRIAARLERFGTDRGGMVVAVTGRTERGDWLTRRWRLLAEAGQGPFIPAVPARAILSGPGPAPGARAAVAERPLDAFQAAMSDLDIRLARDEAPSAPLFCRHLGPDFARLPAAVRDSHATHAALRLTGRATVTRGPGLWPRILAALFRFPPAGKDVPLTVLKTRADTGETWERRFGPRRFRSHLSEAGGAMTERFGPVTFTLDLHIADGALHYPVRGARIGPLPLPRMLLPVSDAQETEQDGRFNFDVALTAPLTGQLIVRYQGWLARHDEGPRP